MRFKHIRSIGVVDVLDTLGSFFALLPVLLLTATWSASAYRPLTHALSETLSREPAAAFAGNAREEMQIPTSPYTAVGKLRFSGHLWCTATLISRDLILTAAHCLFDDNNKLRKGRFSFAPATWLNTGESSFVKDFWWGTNDVVTYPDLDFAVLRLEKPLGDTYGWMRLQPREWSNKKHTLETVSYPDDFTNGKKPTYEKGCRFTFYPWKTPSHVFKLIGHSCTGFDGTSGAGLFYVNGNEARILALNVRGSRYGCPLMPKKPCHTIPYDREHANAAIPAERIWPLVQKVLAGAPSDI